MITVQEVADFVGTSPTEPLLPGLLSRAKVRIDEYLGYRGLMRCPQETYDEAVLQLVSDKWARRNAPNGVATWGPDGEAIKITADDMVAVRPILRRYKSLGSAG